jgi:glycosyltransferase involved in cell wall biosynthesis
MAECRPHRGVAGSLAMTDISVVMGVYNGAETLPATVESILAQEQADFELVAVDDGSTDGSADMLDAYAMRDPRVRVLHQENSGLTRALIAGCTATGGRYIARHDAGDLSRPDRLAKQQSLLDASPEVIFVSCATAYVAPEEEPLWTSRPTGMALTPAWILDARQARLITDGPTHHGSVMFRRNAYERAGGYRTAFYFGQDFDLWYRLAALGKFQTVDEVLYTARVTPGSISNSARIEQERLGRLSQAAARARLRGDSEETILAEAASIRPGPSRPSDSAGGFYFIGETLRRNGDRRARRYLRRALAAAPLSPRTWLRYLQSVLLYR